VALEAKEEAMTFVDQDVSLKDDDLGTVVAGNTAFALALYQKLRAAEGNLFFSPYSLSTALAMTYAGARGNTEAQMAAALHFSLEQELLHAAFARLEARLAGIAAKGEVRLRVANALWPQQGYRLLEAFLAVVQQFYGVQITALDYGDGEAARGQINAWVEDKTENRIQDIIPAGLLDSLTRLVLVNAIYFKGNWASPFDPGLTGEAPFWVAPGQQVAAPLMSMTSEFRYGVADGLQVLELPYAGGELSMVVLLPEEIDGLAGLEERLTAENLARWTEGLWSRQVQVWLPRFEITFPFSLNEVLQSMGMIDAFAEDADFSGMDGTRLLYISAVLHKAFVAVNEEGTEAAAASAVVMTLRSAPAPPAVFRADHPFVFVIREKSTGSLLFLGRVVNPLGALEPRAEEAGAGGDPEGTRPRRGAGGKWALPRRIRTEVLRRLKRLLSG
jgi:serpin B